MEIKKKETMNQSVELIRMAKGTIWSLISLGSISADMTQTRGERPTSKKKKKIIKLSRGNHLKKKN